MLLQLVVAFVVLTSPGLTEAQTLTGCNDPPGNNAIAELVVNALEAVRPLFVSGIPNLGIPPLDPLGPLPSLGFAVNNDALVLDGYVNDTVVRNLAQFVICQVNVQVGITQKFDIEFRLENFHIDGLYDVDGLAVSLFPIFGHGNYTLDTYSSGFAGGATVVYNILQDRASIKNLELEVFFDDLELTLECILGCGQMSDFMNDFLSEIGASIFETVWNNISPIIANAVENIVNDALYNVSISDLIPMPSDGELGNANNYMDLVLANAAQLMLDQELDPALLPDTSLTISAGAAADLSNGSLAGLSTVRRSGTCTVDTVVGWLFLYANVAVGPIQAQYQGMVTEGDQEDVFEGLVSLETVDVYVTARGDVFSFVLDLDQFVISELGPANIELKGLGLMGWLAGPLSEAILNLFLDDLQGALSGQLKDAIQNALNETPWPAP